MSSGSVNTTSNSKSVSFSLQQSAEYTCTTSCSSSTGSEDDKHKQLDNRSQSFGDSNGTTNETSEVISIASINIKSCRTEIDMAGGTSFFIPMSNEIDMYGWCRAMQQNMGCLCIIKDDNNKTRTVLCIVVDVPGQAYLVTTVESPAEIMTKSMELISVQQSFLTTDLSCKNLNIKDFTFTDKSHLKTVMERVASLIKMKMKNNDIWYTSNTNYRSTTTST